MVLFASHMISPWILALGLLNCHPAWSQEAYPNPFKKPAQPAAQQNLGNQDQGGAYPNPFKPAGPAPAPGGTENPGPEQKLPVTKPASPDPDNVAGTCCCDSRNTFITSTTPQPNGGCCAPGLKWGCGCQDTGSFLVNPLTCPVLNRNTRVTPSGPRFELFCNVQTQRKTIKIDDQNTLVECVDACGALPGCVGVDFHKVDLKCYYKSEYMEEDTEGAIDNDVDSATMPPPTRCPQAEGQLKTIGGVEYKIFCDGPTKSFTHEQFGGYATADECAEFCSKKSKCQGFDFRPADKQCFTCLEYQNPPSGRGETKEYITFMRTKKR